MPETLLSSSSILEAILIKYILVLSFSLASSVALSQAKAPTSEKSKNAPTNWEIIAIDRDAFGQDKRIFEVDLNSRKSSSSATKVNVRITSNSTGRVGYNCSPQELQYKKLDATIADLICDRNSSPNPFGQRDAEWKLVRSTKIASGGVMSLFFDMNGISRAGDTVSVQTRHSDVSVVAFEFDCKGYFKRGNKWETLDMTDRIATVPRGYISPERKTEQAVCAQASIQR